ncbi:hypothetical protein SNEBB_004107 [Seison nebaliae]|nr:hypothetical protein SNEBB_004107 [Seison nebaliae]
MKLSISYLILILSCLTYGNARTGSPSLLGMLSHNVKPGKLGLAISSMEMLNEYHHLQKDLTKIVPAIGESLDETKQSLLNKAKEYTELGEQNSFG